MVIWGFVYRYVSILYFSFVSLQQTFSRLGIMQTLRDLPFALGLSKTLFGAITAEGSKKGRRRENLIQQSEHP